MRPFRFGVNAWNAESRDGWVRKARRLEELGYSSLLMPDHLTEMLSPFAALAAAAAATSRLRVGTFVLNNDLRHPALVAREIATLDLLSEGRVELGLGAGYAEPEYTAAGLPFDRGRVRVERLAESVALIKAMFAGEPVSFEGAHYTLRSHRLFPPPVQNPRPPLMLGGNGRAVLALAARDADIVGFTGATFPRGGRRPTLATFGPDAFGERIEWVRSAAQGRGEVPELNILIQQAVIAETPERAAATALERFRSLDLDGALASPFLLLGPVDHVVETLRQRRERWGISYIVVFDADADAFAPVVERLSGK